MRIAFIFLSVPVLLGCFVLTAACGKKGDPEPRDEARTFRWAEAEAAMAGPCLAFRGVLEGAFANLDGIRVEVAPVQGSENCPGCPFVPRETAQFSPRDAGFDPASGAVTFAYCPGPAPAYLWRIIGINIYTALPHAVSPVKLTGNLP
ncbi:MAG: hypothetical protein LBO77_07150 [Desulfovibrio sp.]|jgi:hypothetical protein|nr:hypothetical protein [Desulfovibrio sp.]